MEEVKGDWTEALQTWRKGETTGNRYSECRESNKLLALLPKKSHYADDFTKMMIIVVSSNIP